MDARHVAIVPTRRDRYTAVFESEFLDELAKLKRAYESIKPYDLAGHFIATVITGGGRSLFDIIRGADEEREVIAVLSGTPSQRLDRDLSVPLLGDCDDVVFGVTLSLQAVGVLEIGHPIIVLWDGNVFFPAGPARTPRRKERTPCPNN